MQRVKKLITILGVFALPGLGLSNLALAELPTYTLTIKEHRFLPEKLEVAAAEKFKLEVINEDASAEEFESYSLNREKIVAGKSKISMFVGPLEPGSYDFFGEFHPESAKGVIVAVAK